MADLGGVIPAWTTARLIAAAKWRTVRTAWARVWMWVALIACAGLLSGAAQAGDMIRAVAETEGQGSAAGVVANTYIRQWVVTGFGTLTSAILAFVLAATVIAPLMSHSAPSLMPEHHLVGVRTARMHPYMSALAVHVTSIVTGVQLLALTALAGLLTVDGSGRSRAVLLAWLAWLVLVFAAQTALWGSRVLRRRAPTVFAWALGALVAWFGVEVLLFPSAATGLFGVSSAFTWWSLVAPVWLSVGIALLAAATAWLAGWAWCACAVHTNTVTAPAVGRDRTTRPMPVRPTTALLALVARSFLRTRPIVTPLVTITVLAAAGVAITDGAPATVWSIGVGLPVALGLAWTDNVAAMTGPANAWLASLPGQASRLLAVWAVWAFTVSVTLVAVAWAPALILGRVSFASTVSVAATGVAAASTVTAAALWHAVRRPAPARTDLGDGMLTASRAASASLRLLAVPGLVAWLATSGAVAVRVNGTTAPLVVQVLGTVCCVLASAAVGALTAYRWSDPRTRANCLAGAS